MTTNDENPGSAPSGSSAPGSGEASEGDRTISSGEPVERVSEAFDVEGVPVTSIRHLRDEGTIHVFEGFDVETGDRVEVAADHREADSLEEVLGDDPDAVAIFPSWSVLFREAVETTCPPRQVLPAIDDPESEPVFETVLLLVPVDDEDEEVGS